MSKITKIVNAGYFTIQWGIPVFASDELQDYWEADENDNVCKINVQLLYNSNSEILEKKPEILKLLDKNTSQKVKLSFSDFLIKNKEFDNIHQSLYEESIVFSYQTKDELVIGKEVVIKKLTEDVYVVFNENFILRYLIIENISKFTYSNIDYDLRNLNPELRQKIIELYFEIYTYNQDNKIEIEILIDKISRFIRNTLNLDLKIVDFLNDEMSYLNEELE